MALLTLQSTPMFVDLFYNDNAVQVVLNELFPNSTLGRDQIFTSTRKTKSCIYNYFTDSIPCNTNTTGYVATVREFVYTWPFQFHTFTQVGLERLEQKVLVCSNLTSSTANTTNNTQPDSKNSTRAFAFIVDTSEGDPNIFNMTAVGIFDYKKKINSGCD